MFYYPEGCTDQMIDEVYVDDETKNLARIEEILAVLNPQLEITLSLKYEGEYGWDVVDEKGTLHSVGMTLDDLRHYTQGMIAALAYRKDKL